ncbi:hypothetical protein DERP_004742 [Dermatophagoides pteronyssinus]|uniref:Uncharacterized protein n=1 Tax=Dermatophagoides pteronyssinus TaxID=6956 RepID=A0ABQ8JQ85_DERPT|nr:hypothetical protein DERP_004742 [Dermatophagoides pteronyssinus]
MHVLMIYSGGVQRKITNSIHHNQCSSRPSMSMLRSSFQPNNFDDATSDDMVFHCLIDKKETIDADDDLASQKKKDLTQQRMINGSVPCICQKMQDFISLLLRGKDIQSNYITSSNSCGNYLNKN